MALIHWQKSFNLGIPDVDREHKELVDLINLVHDRSIRVGGRAAIEEALGQIVARVSAHFSNEERLMLVLEYPEYWAHKADHQRLLDQLSGFIAQYQTAQVLDSAVLAQCLESWFMIHFRSFDASFHRFVQHRRG
jgi:hemerythrin